MAVSFWVRAGSALFVGIVGLSQFRKSRAVATWTVVLAVGVGLTLLGSLPQDNAAPRVPTAASRTARALSDVGAALVVCAAAVLARRLKKQGKARNAGGL
jgi:hypothetical protein